MTFNLWLAALGFPAVVAGVGVVANVLVNRHDRPLNDELAASLNSHPEVAAEVVSDKAEDLVHVL